MSTFKLGDTVFYGDEQVEIIDISEDGQDIAILGDAFNHFGEWSITVRPDQLSAHADNPHYARAARLESEMDTLSASGDHEGAAVKRTLMMAALWDWYMSEKRGEK